VVDSDFCPHTDKHLAILSKRTFDTQSIHIFGLVYYLSTSRNSPFYIRCYTYGKRPFVSMRAKKNPAGIKLQYFCQYGDRKKTNQRTKLTIYMLDTIESESTTRFKNRSSDRMMTSDWLLDVSDDRYTTNDNLSSVSQNVLKFYQQLTGEERRVPFIFGHFWHSVNTHIWTSLLFIYFPE
jgi:hypothetical protein